MHEDPLLQDLVFAVFAAFVGGLVAHRLRQPAIVGYLLAGLAISTFAPRSMAESHALQVLAEVGVAFLMFAHGAEFSRGDLRRLARLSAVAGVLQILVTIGIGTALAPLLGLSIAQGVFLGGILALSSAAVAMKLLIGRGELHTLHGQIAVGVLIRPLKRRHRPTPRHLPANMALANDCLPHASPAVRRSSRRSGSLRA